MSQKQYDTFILGQISLDINIDYGGNTVKEFGGAVVHSGYSAASLGHKVGVLTKNNTKDVDAKTIFERSKGIDVYVIDCEKGTSIQNKYLSADMEKRVCTALSQVESYKIDEFPKDISSEIYHIAGLMNGDIPVEFIPFLSKKAKLAIDVQGILRCNDNGNMHFLPWKEQEEYLPMITYLKTDAAEAEIMTGLTDRYKAAELLHSWGAKEVMITHNSEVLVYDGTNHYAVPLKPRNLTGRTGRGDTCFSAYITERINNDIQTALTMAAATVSLKMETPGPFLGDRSDVEKYIAEFY